MSASKLTQSRPATSSEVRLVEVLDAYMAAAQLGRAPSREALLADHPELAEDLEACLASLEFIGRASLTAAPPVVDSQFAEVETGEAGIGDLGDFRLVAEIGRGGMGVVYEAMQRSLNRRVALKVLPFAAAMDPTQLRRFQTEALAAAQLHHTHIVPVYSVGCERGVHYYAMQFIEGQTLAQAIAERKRIDGTPTETRPSAIRKPVLPQPRVLPNGRRAGHPGGRGARPRAQGRHRAPRHQAGQPVAGRPGQPLGHGFRPGPTPGRHRPDDHRRPAGHAPLHEPRAGAGEAGLPRPSHRHLLAGRDALRAGDAPAGDRRARPAGGPSQDRPGRADPAATAQPAIPRELETILLKAMSKEPESRYATAQELADDLRRFLDDKPIKAKRPSFWERGSKWSRRHQTAVATAVSFSCWQS